MARNLQRGLGAALGTFARVLGAQRAQRRDEEARQAEIAAAEEARRQEASNQAFQTAAAGVPVAGSLGQLRSLESGFRASPAGDRFQELQPQFQQERERLTREQQQAAFEQARQIVASGQDTATGTLERIGQPEGGQQPGLDQVALSQEQIGRLVQTQGAQRASARQAADAARVETFLGFLPDAVDANDAIARANTQSAADGTGELGPNEEAVIRQAFDLVAAGEDPELPYDVSQARLLADGYVKDTQQYRLRLDGMERIRGAKEDGTGPSDIDIIFAYMKVLDPISVVREGEAEAVRSSGSLDQRTRAWFENVMSGGSFEPEQRRQILQAATRVFGVEEKLHEQLVERYKAQAQAFSIPEDIVIIDWKAGFDAEAETAETQGAAQPEPRERLPARGPNARSFSEAELREFNALSPTERQAKLDELREFFPNDFAEYARLFPGGR